MICCITAQVSCCHNRITKAQEVYVMSVPGQLTPDLKKEREEVNFDLLLRVWSQWKYGFLIWWYGLKHEYILKAQSIEWHHISPGLKKLKSQWLAKVMQLFIGMARTSLALIFLNSKWYTKTPKKLIAAIKRKKQNKNLTTIRIHYDNAQPHTHVLQQIR